MESYYSFNTPAEDVKPEVFVGRMDGIAFQPESHQDGFDTQYPFEITDNGNTPSTPYRQRL